MTPAPTTPPQPSKTLGYLSGLAFIAIWSFFMVIARLGVTGNLTPYDITALRFMIASVLTLPFVFLYWPPHLSWVKILTLAALGPGALYSGLMYSGLGFSPAAFAGVFANGAMPIFTAVFAWIWLRERLNKNAAIAITIILAGSVLVAYQSLTTTNGDNLSGLPFFIGASLIVAAYSVLVRIWKLTAKQTLAIINLPNALVFLPIWYFFLPSTLASASTNDILLQLIFQGLGPGFLALIFFTYTIQALGPTATSAFAATVPATAALLAIPILGETLNTIEWIGVLVVTIGLALLILRRKN